MVARSVRVALVQLVAAVWKDFSSSFAVHSYDSGPVSLQLPSPHALSTQSSMSAESAPSRCAQPCSPRTGIGCCCCLHPCPEQLVCHGPRLNRSPGCPRSPSCPHFSAGVKLLRGTSAGPAHRGCTQRSHRSRKSLHCCSWCSSQISPSAQAHSYEFAQVCTSCVAEALCAIRNICTIRSVTAEPRWSACTLNAAGASCIRVHVCSCVGRAPHGCRAGNDSIARGSAFVACERTRRGENHDGCDVLALNQWLAGVRAVHPVS